MLVEAVVLARLVPPGVAVVDRVKPALSRRLPLRSVVEEITRPVQTDTVEPVDGLRLPVLVLSMDTLLNAAEVLVELRQRLRLLRVVLVEPGHGSEAAAVEAAVESLRRHRVPQSVAALVV